MINNITTIQIHENVKEELTQFKEKNESYEEIILKLMKHIKMEKRQKAEYIIEGYKEMAKESLEITKEWSSTETGWK